MILVPVGILVLLMLATIAVDGANAMLGQRQLADNLAAAAADAAGAGLDDQQYYGAGQVVLDPSLTVAAVCAAVAAQADQELHDIRLAVGVAGPVVTVRARAVVDTVFGAVFGLRSWQVTATATADAETAATATAVPAAPLATSAVSC